MNTLTQEQLARSSRLETREFALDLAFAETANQVVACADRHRHHGKRRVLARGRHKARSVHHEQIFHVVRLVERIAAPGDAWLSAVIAVSESM